MNPEPMGGAVVIFGTVLALLMVTIIFVLLAKRQLAEKYAVLWLVIGIAGIVIAVFPGLLGWLTRTLHIQLPSNLLFGGAILLLVGVCLHLSWELSRAEDEVRRLAEETAINRLEIDKLSRRIAGLEAPGAPPAADRGSQEPGGPAPRPPDETR
ncbi:MAG: DUF2304 domain-containing protein [Leucobacter sp.]